MGPTPGKPDDIPHAHTPTPNPPLSLARRRRRFRSRLRRCASAARRHHARERCNAPRALLRPPPVRRHRHRRRRPAAPPLLPQRGYWLAPRSRFAAARSREPHRPCHAIPTRHFGVISARTVFAHPTPAAPPARRCAAVAADAARRRNSRGACRRRRRAAAAAASSADDDSSSTRVRLGSVIRCAMTLNDDCIRRPHEGGGAADTLLRPAGRLPSHQTRPLPCRRWCVRRAFYIDMLG